MDGLLALPLAATSPTVLPLLSTPTTRSLYLRRLDVDVGADVLIAYEAAKLMLPSGRPATSPTKTLRPLTARPGTASVLDEDNDDDDEVDEDDKVDMTGFVVPPH